MPMPKPTVQDYRNAFASAKAALALLDEMEKAGALRLPFPGHPAVLAKLKAVTG